MPQTPWYSTLAQRPGSTPCPPLPQTQSVARPPTSPTSPPTPELRGHHLGSPHCAALRCLSRFTENRAACPRGSSELAPQHPAPPSRPALPQGAHGRQHGPRALGLLAGWSLSRPSLRSVLPSASVRMWDLPPRVALAASSSPPLLSWAAGSCLESLATSLTDLVRAGQPTCPLFLWCLEDWVAGFSHPLGLSSGPWGRVPGVHAATCSSRLWAG